MQKVRLSHAIQVALVAAALVSATALGAEPTAAAADAATSAPAAELEPQAEAQDAAAASKTTPAESTPAAAKTTELEGITVSGYAQSLGNAIAIKQTADVIVDVVSAEDVGKFPDINVAESLQRITGVQISRLSSDGSTANEGKYISVRGLPTEFNYVGLNGESVASASDSLISQSASRNFDFSVLSPDFISTLEVYKSPKADLTEGGVSATVDVKTVLPLDLGKQVLKASLGAQQSTGLDKKTPNASVIYSDVFADKTFGVTLGAAWNRRQYLNSSWTAAQLDPQTIDGTPYTVLDNIGISQIKNTLDTKTFYGALQWRPEPDLDFSLVGIHAKTKDSQVQSAFNLRPQYASTYSGLVANPDGVLTTQIGDDTYYEDQTFQTWNTNKLDDISFKTQWRPGNWDIGGSLGYSNSRTHSDQIGIDTLESGRFAIGPNYTGGYRILPGDPIASFVLDPNFDVANPNNYFMNYTGGNVLDRSDIIRSAKVDAVYNFNDGIIEALHVGVRYQEEVNTNSAAFYQGASLGRIPVTPFASSSWPLGSVLGGYDGNATVPTNFPFLDPQLYLNDYFGGSYRNFLNSSTTRVSRDPTNQYSITEDSTAAYAMADFKFEWKVPIHGNFGVRLVKTDTTIVDNTYDPNAVEFVNPPPPPPQPAVIAPAYTPISFDHSYDDVLPSFNLTADLREDLFLRFAAAEVMSRPTLDAMVPKYSFSYSGPTAANSFQSGNPNLDPFKATQFDVSLEYYFGANSLLSAAYFYKDIDTFIQVQHTPITIQDIPFDRAIPVNSSGGHVKGIEANYVQTFDFLPGFWSGFGTQINATWATGSTDADTVNNIPAHTFQNLSKWTANGTVFWERDGWSIRVAYNYRGPYLADPNLRGTGTRAFGNQFSTVDMQASYAINPHLTVFAEGNNLLAHEQSFSMKTATGSTPYPQTWISGDRRVAVGARLSF